MLTFTNVALSLLIAAISWNDGHNFLQGLHLLRHEIHNTCCREILKTLTGWGRVVRLNMLYRIVSVWSFGFVCPECGRFMLAGVLSDSVQNMDTALSSRYDFQKGKRSLPHPKTKHATNEYKTFSLVSNILWSNIPNISHNIIAQRRKKVHSN